MEVYAVHGPGDQFAARKIKGCHEPGVLIDPFQQIAPKENAVVIEMLGADDSEIVQKIA